MGEKEVGGGKGQPTRRAVGTGGTALADSRNASGGKDRRSAGGLGSSETNWGPEEDCAHVVRQRKGLKI